VKRRKPNDGWAEKKKNERKKPKNDGNGME